MAERSYTPEQIKVIEHGEGHAVVSAVAGSGKTETLVGRVRQLLKEHTPAQIAVVMFNRDAREAFQKRCQKAIAGPAPEIRTFNSMGNKIVQRLVSQGLLPDAKIVEKDFQRAKIAAQVFTRVFKSINGDDAAPDKELIDEFISFILLVKSEVRSAEEVFDSRPYGKSALGFPDAFRLYEQQRIKMKIRFFEDQVYDPVKLLLRHPEYQRLIANKVDHLIVDEAQDVNGIQIELLKMLAGTRAKVMLCGDEDQAIYEWRGAKPDYITRGFERDFSGATRYTLPHTFRFGHTLSLAASHVITRNANRNPKISISAPTTPKTRIHSFGLALGTAGFGELVSASLADGFKPDEIAILVRTYSVAVALELELHQHGIPYFVYGRPPLQRIPEISAMVGVLQLASGRWKNLPTDEARFVINSLLWRPALYLSKEAIHAVIDRSLEQPDHLSEAVRSAITPQLQPFQADQIRDRADLLDIIATCTDPDEKPVQLLDRYLSGTSFDKSIIKQSPTAEVAETILANVAAFRALAAKHEGTIAEFLDDIDPLIDSTNLDPPSVPHVWIGSIHRAKGAQWPIVMLPGLAARSFPRDHITQEELEAERRFFYVAMTRAVEELYLIHPVDSDFDNAIKDIKSDAKRGFECPTSPFLWEMDLAVARYAAEAIENEGPFESVPLESPAVANEYFKRFPFAKDWAFTRLPRGAVRRPAETPIGSLASLREGVRVHHDTFGPGTFERWVDNRVYHVRFDSGETKMLVAHYAPIRVLAS